MENCKTLINYTREQIDIRKLLQNFKGNLIWIYIFFK